MHIMVNYRYYNKNSERKIRYFSNNFIALDDELRTVPVAGHPFAIEKSHGEIGIVRNRKVIDEGVRCFWDNLWI